MGVGVLIQNMGVGNTVLIHDGTISCTHIFPILIPYVLRKMKEKRREERKRNDGQSDSKI